MTIQNKTKIRTAVVPAAGLGTRFLPATKVLPKEMMPIVDKPLIQYAVEEAVASGLESVILVVGPGKNLLTQHFERDLPLENVLLRYGRTEVAEQIRRLSELANIRTVWQEAPLGLADAVGKARSLIGDEPFAVILPDALIDSSVPCIGQLLSCYQKTPGCIIATRVVDASEVSRFGILDLEPMSENSLNGRVSRVKNLIERPQPMSVSSRNGIFGRYILEADIFSCIDRTRPGFNGELQLTDSILLCSDKVPIYACEFEGNHYDAGSKGGFLQATIAYALKDPKLELALREFMIAFERVGSTS